jgi:hypothetical protein
MRFQVLAVTVQNIRVSSPPKTVLGNDVTNFKEMYREDGKWKELAHIVFNGWL